MKKMSKMASLALACAMMLTLSLGAGVALADGDYWVPAYDHNGHAHAGYWTELSSVTSDTSLAHDPSYLTLTGAATVYSSPFDDATALDTLEAGDHVCYIQAYSNGWVHVYYNDGDNAGWIRDSAL